MSSRMSTLNLVHEALDGLPPAPLRAMLVFATAGGFTMPPMASLPPTASARTAAVAAARTDGSRQRTGGLVWGVSAR